ncbi:MAG: hypothetical protein ACYC8V_02135 [Caulobacteraceae bacterium]
MCEVRGSECAEPVMRADWLGMASHWRRLGDDENAQATTARLLQGARVPG